MLSTNPANGATHVAVSTVGPGNVVTPRTVSAVFSEAMNPASIVSPALTFTLKERLSGNNVAGTVTMNAAGTVATLTPAAVLASNTQFIATITNAATSVAGIALAYRVEWSFTTGSHVGQAPVDLATAASFLVLAGTSIDNISSQANPTRINGQLGIWPGLASSVHGFTESTPAGTGIILTGGIQTGDIVRQAQNDLLAAKNDAGTRSSFQVAVGTQDLSQLAFDGGAPGVYPPGLYVSGSSLALITGNMVLDARGDPDAVWIFRAGSSLTVADSRKLFLINGARAANVFWDLGSSATVGDQVDFKGSIMSATSNTVGTGTATSTGTAVEGRVLAHSTSVVLNFTTVNAPAP